MNHILRNKKRSKPSTYIYLLYILRVLAVQYSSNTSNSLCLGFLVHAFVPTSSPRWKTSNGWIGTSNGKRKSAIQFKNGNHNSVNDTTTRCYPPQIIRSATATAIVDEVEVQVVATKVNNKTRESRNNKKNIPILQIQPLNHVHNNYSVSATLTKNDNVKFQHGKRTATANVNTNNNNKSKIKINQSEELKNKTTLKMKRRNLHKSSTTTSSSTIRVSNLLTREEEAEFTTSIRELKAVIRVRDELSVHKTMNNPGSTKSYLPNPMYKYQEEELRFKIQPTEQEWAQSCKVSITQLRKILSKGREARRRLVDANVGLVTQIAKKYFNALRKSTSGGVLTLSDLIQEGNLGIMEAAERFEADKGFRFSTYAVHWVRARILRSIADNSRVIRLPAHGK